MTLRGRHVASSVRLTLPLPPFNLVNSQRPPPHSFNWTSWYWGKQKGRVNILSRHGHIKIKKKLDDLPF